MGLLTAVGLLPHLLFSLPAGVWLDRVHRRRRLMIVVDLGPGRADRDDPHRVRVQRAEPAPAVRDHLRWSGRCRSLSTSRGRPSSSRSRRARTSSRPTRCSTAAARWRTSLGPSIGGILIQVLGAAAAMLTDALSYVASALLPGSSQGRGAADRAGRPEHPHPARRPACVSSSAIRSCVRRCCRSPPATCSTWPSTRCSSCTSRRISTSSPGCSGSPLERAPSVA